MRRPRRGFTLVELLIAIVLVDLALLALAAVATSATRQLGEAVARAAALRQVRARVEQLAVGPCGERSGSADWGRGGVEAWSVTPTGSVQRIEDSIVYARPGGRTARGSVGLRTMTPC